MPTTDEVRKRCERRLWLGAGMMTAGLAAAIASGQGMAAATADEGSTASSASAGSSAGDSSAPGTSATTDAGRDSSQSESVSAGGVSGDTDSDADSTEPTGTRGQRVPSRLSETTRSAARHEASTRGDESDTMAEFGRPRTVAVADIDVEAGSEAESQTAAPVTDTVAEPDAVIVEEWPDKPYDRRRSESDIRRGQTGRDDGHAAGRPAVDEQSDRSPSTDEDQGSSEPAVAQSSSLKAATSAAAAEPAALGSVVHEMMARLGLTPVMQVLDHIRTEITAMIQHAWSQVRTLFLRPSANPVVVPPDTAPGNPSAGTSDPVLLWETNFTSLAEAMQSWSLQSGRWGQSAGENQYYTPDFSNVTVDENGYLVISVRREATPDNAAAPHDYTSARVVSYGNQSVMPNSRIVARIQMPYAEGLLPAFWMVGLEPGHEFDWPRQGEVDIAEYPGFGSADGRTQWTGNIHGPAAGDNTVDVKLHDVGADIGTDLSAGFHEYGIDWYADRIVWHVDGVQTGQVTKAEYEAMGGDWTPFSGAWPHYLILNVAVGNPWTGDPDPTAAFPEQQMKVDWVRVYSLDAVAT
ncbi:family 16 glycosylhydrolase [Mycolicibacterium neoaurum]|uniref:family 16 glycosylhydrolase n=1 Tax=Mycolicibacterium neoaurum TaxID=1795 RepID=UPI0026720BA9|nr:family 16 glycosylhydrolase [Mycolicibacterium neoaurum]MDO3402441.1 family 16 glycosylhydrolase [Mycolicibacterium neoaurum]